MRINYRLGWLAVGGRGGRRAGSRVPLDLDGGRDTKQRGEDEAVVSADLQTNEHASERDGQPADLSFRLEVREKKKRKKKKERGKGGHVECGMRVRVSEARGLSACVCVAECRCCVWLGEEGGQVPWQCCYRRPWTISSLHQPPMAHVEARSQNAGLVITRTISTRRDDAHRTSPTLTPSAGASSELANRHSHLPVGRALEEQLFLPPAARGIASFAAVCDVFMRWKCSNYCVRCAVNGLLG